MGNTAFDYLLDQKPDTSSTPAANVQKASGANDNAFDYLIDPNAQKAEPGFVGGTLNNMHHLFNLYQYYGKMVGTSTINPDVEKDLDAKLAEANLTLEPALKKYADDIRNTFTKMGGDPNGDKANSAVDAAIEQSKKTSLLDVLKGLPLGFESMITSPVESLTGLGLSHDEFTVMTPEERNAKMKETTGNILGLAAGAVVGKLVGAGLGTMEASATAGAAEQLGTKALMGVARSQVKGALARKMVKSTLEGGAFGAVQGALAHANEDEQLTSMIVGGILFAPIMGAIGLIGGHDPLDVYKTTYDKNGVKVKERVGFAGKRAWDIAQVRQAQLSEGFSLQDVANWKESFATADDMVDAIVNKNMLDDKSVFAVDGPVGTRVGKLIEEKINARNDAFDEGAKEFAAINTQKYNEYQLAYQEQQKIYNEQSPEYIAAKAKADAAEQALIASNDALDKFHITQGDPGEVSDLYDKQKATRDKYHNVVLMLDNAINEFHNAGGNYNNQTSEAIFVSEKFNPEQVANLHKLKNDITNLHTQQKALDNEVDAIGTEISALHRKSREKAIPRFRVIQSGFNPAELEAVNKELEEKVGAPIREIKAKQVALSDAHFEQSSKHKGFTNEYHKAQNDYAKAYTELTNEQRKILFDQDNLIQRQLRIQEAHNEGIPYRTIVIGKDNLSLTADDMETFSNTGFLPNEIVSVGGQDHIMLGQEKEQLHALAAEFGRAPRSWLVVEHPITGEVKKVPLSEVSTTTTGLAQHNIETFTSKLNLKGRYLRESALTEDGETSFELANRKALADGGTGKPLSVYGFRQVKGMPAVADAVFHSSTGLGVAGYSPRDAGGMPLGRQSKSAGSIHSLTINKLTFENPLFVEGAQGDLASTHTMGHLGLIKGLFKDKFGLDLTDPEKSMIRAAYERTSKVTGSEKRHDPYHLVDRAISSVLKKRGFDGIIYKRGGEIVDLTRRTLLDMPKEKTTASFTRLGIINQESLRQKFYSDFVGEQVKDAQLEYAKTPKDKNLIGADDQPPARLADLVPAKSFNELLDDYMSRKGIDPYEKDFLKQDFQKRLVKDLENAGDLSVEDQTVITNLRRRAEVSIIMDKNDKEFARQDDVKNFHKAAKQHGIYIDEGEGNNFVLRDAESDKIMGRFTKVSDATRFINEGGQPKGIALDGGGGNGLIPTSDIQPTGEGPLRPNETPFIASPDGWFGNITSTFNSIADFLTPNREILIAYDNKFKTNLFQKIYDTTQVARARTNAAILPWYNRLKGIEAIGKKMKMSERRIAGGYLETMNTEEALMHGGPGGRAINNVEEYYARAFANTGGDVKRAMQYNREIDLWTKDHPNAKPEELAQYLVDVQDAMKLDNKDMQAASLHRTMLTQNKGSIGAAVRLADILNNGGGMNRDEYAAHHEMKPEHVAMAKQLEQFFKDAAPVFGIAPEHMLANYMTHARLYAKGDISGALNFFDTGNSSGNKEFYARMVRTGEVDAYELDPIRAAQRYIKAGFDAKMFQDTLDQAKKDLNVELLKVPDDAQKEIKRVTERYLSDLQGNPGAGSKFTQVAVDHFTNSLGLNLSLDVRKNVVNTISATFEAAAQGFRIVAGIRDFYTGVSLYYARFGTVRTARMLKMGLTGLDEMTRHSLATEGITPTLSPVAFSTPTEFTSTVLGRSTGLFGKALRGVADVGLKLSGQKDVYAVMHAGAYLDTWSMVGEQMRRYNKGEITLPEAYKNLSLESYHAPVANAFHDLIKAGKYDEAAQFLGRNTGSEQVGVFGLGNNPGGWNTNIGRIAGQFGSWSMWYRAHVMQMVSRGSYGYRAASVARLAATQAALAGVGSALGINFASWYLSGPSVADPFAAWNDVSNSDTPVRTALHKATVGMIPTGVMFGGGPFVSALETINSATQGSGVEQKLAQNRMKSMLPWDGEKFNISHIWVPGSYFVNDLARAYSLTQSGATAPKPALQAAGFRVTPEP